MQNCTTILGIIDMRQRGISYDDCRSRYHIGCSTIFFDHEPLSCMRQRS